MRISDWSSDVCSSDLILARPLHPALGISARPCQPAGWSNGRNGMMASEKLFGLHATALQMRSQRMMMLASNSANAATPNYKARDIDLAKELDRAQQGPSTEGQISYRWPVQAEVDGN